MGTHVQATLVALLLLESVQLGRQRYEPQTVQSFDPAVAERLLAKGAAIVPPPSPARPAAEPVVVEQTVKALSDAGMQFQRLKSTEKAVAFVAAQPAIADVAELQALEFRREGGPRPELVEAFGAAFRRLSGAAAE